MVLKKPDKVPQVLTTGQVAQICSVAPRTVSKWFDMGQLRGYRIPGSRDRRIPLEQLIRFMKAHNMPLNGLDGGPRRILLVVSDEELAGTIRPRLEQAGFCAQTARTPFEAGLLVERFRPHVVVLDNSSPEAMAGSVALAVRKEPQLSDVKLLALDGEQGEQPAPAMPRRGFDARLARPFNISQMVEAINGLVQQ